MVYRLTSVKSQSQILVFLPKVEIYLILIFKRMIFSKIGLIMP
jgi:hypothetical protein